MNSRMTFPVHGRMDCRVCFEGAQAEHKPHPKWRMRNDPGAWGSENPEVLVLGFSKGSTQANIYANGRFEDVAFAGMRPRLTRTLQHFKLLGEGQTADSAIANPSGRFAFGSLIRCSVARLDPKLEKQGVQQYSCTGPLIPKSFVEIPQVVSRCAERYLTNLPDRLRLVVFLGNSDAYVEGCQALVRRLYPETYRAINPMAVSADGRLWVHLSHPSGLNGHFEQWLAGPASGTGRKRAWVEEALSAQFDAG